MNLKETEDLVLKGLFEGNWSFCPYIHGYPLWKKNEVNLPKKQGGKGRSLNKVIRDALLLYYTTH